MVTLGRGSIRCNDAIFVGDELLQVSIPPVAEKSSAVLCLLVLRSLNANGLGGLRLCNLGLLGFDEIIFGLHLLGFQLELLQALVDGQD